MGTSNSNPEGTAAAQFLSIVREGRSFSGNEPHCAFLNTGTQGFANVSSISGFDWADDGRAAALVDWDSDGDLDVWISNRNSPQLRFLLNQMQTTNHFLTICLQGVQSNRDGIGARVRVFTDQTATPISRTLRAGDGFLAQSSKRLHIGLGDATSIDRVEVTWPLGKQQTFQVTEVDRTLLFIEGDPAPHPIATSARKLLDSDPVKPIANQGDSEAMSFSMIRLPANHYQSSSGKLADLVEPQDRLTLLNLWAAWCQPCIRELEEFSQQSQALRALRIDIVALNVDDLLSSGAQQDGQSHQSQQLLKKMNFPFRAGQADAELLFKLQLLNDTIFESHAPLPVPSSFLLDRQGRVIAIYRGPVSVEQLVQDVGKLSAAKTTAAWRAASLPFPGHWIMPPRRRNLFEFVEELAKHGHLEQGRSYVEATPKMFLTHPRWQQLSRILSISSP
ncbi:MAG: ASPIC/UnbV domain-containing protein [Pirellulaceae bacterium]|nr:ASPIC/UnbV domain-containing protein [Pirellulaceae bacterium]